MSRIGSVVHWNDKKGFGFIRRPDGFDVFFHVTGLPPAKGRRSIALDTIVEFELVERRGDIIARDIKIVALPAAADGLGNK